MKQQKNAIALLVTILFVMLISVSIGYGLLQLKQASQSLQDEKMLYQESMILDDVLTMLQTSKELQALVDQNISEELYTFLSTSSYIPVDFGDMKFVISIKSARSHLNINMLNNDNEALFRAYFSRNMVENSYVDILKSCMRKNQAQNEYNNYNNALFDQHPELFREYIASKKHLQQINDFYLDEYHDDALKKVDFDGLFSYGEDVNSSVDLNYATVAVWQLMLDVSKERAEALYASEGTYKSVNDLNLNSDERENLAKFHTSFFEPYLSITIDLIGEESLSKIEFEYAIKTKRGYNFVLEI